MKNSKYSAKNEIIMNDRLNLIDMKIKLDYFSTFIIMILIYDWSVKKKNIWYEKVMSVFYLFITIHSHCQKYLSKFF